MIQLRKAALGDLPAIATIFREAVEVMLAEGKRQWSENYPTAGHARADIEGGVGYVLEEDGRVVAYSAVIFDGEPAYAAIEGRWLTEREYVVAHRMAVSKAMKGKGIGRYFFERIAEMASEKGTGSFRIDTNFDNDRMLALLARLGFRYCGRIHYESGERLAFEKPLR